MLTLYIRMLNVLFNNIERQVKLFLQSPENILHTTKLEQINFLQLNEFKVNSSLLNFFFVGDIKENEVNTEKELQISVGKYLQFDSRKSHSAFSEHEYLNTLDTNRNTARSATLINSVDFLLV